MHASFSFGGNRSDSEFTADVDFRLGKKFTADSRSGSPFHEDSRVVCPMSRFSFPSLEMRVISMSFGCKAHETWILGDEFSRETQAKDRTNRCSFLSSFSICQANAVMRDLSYFPILLFVFSMPRLSISYSRLKKRQSNGMICRLR